MLCVHPGELGRNRFPVGRVPVLLMRINVAKEDGYLCRILAVEVRRVKCVFPRNKVQKEMTNYKVVVMGLKNKNDNEMTMTMMTMI